MESITPFKVSFTIDSASSHILQYFQNICSAPTKGEDIMREEYLKEITPLLEKCDISTLDLIYQILFKKCQNAC
jgi:hypothetical protein